MESICRYSHYIVVTNIARYSYQVLPQMVCRSSNLLNLMTEGSVWYNNCLILTNTDDWLIYAKHLKNQMLKLRICNHKNLNLNPNTKEILIKQESGDGGTDIMT